MNCTECGGKYKKTKGCIEKTYKNFINENLLKEPLSAFITSSDMLKIMNTKSLLTFSLTRKQLDKLRKFTLNIKIGNQILYLKDSIEAYKRTGDGRYVRKWKQDNKSLVQF